MRKAKSTEKVTKTKAKALKSKAPQQRRLRSEAAATPIKQARGRVKPAAKPAQKQRTTKVAASVKATPKAKKSPAKAALKVKTSAAGTRKSVARPRMAAKAKAAAKPAGKPASVKAKVARPAPKKTVGKVKAPLKTAARSRPVPKSAAKVARKSPVTRTPLPKAKAPARPAKAAARPLPRAKAAPKKPLTKAAPPARRPVAKAPLLKSAPPKKVATTKPAAKKTAVPPLSAATPKPTPAKDPAAVPAAKPTARRARKARPAAVPVPAPVQTLEPHHASPGAIVLHRPRVETPTAVAMALAAATARLSARRVRDLLPVRIQTRRLVLRAPIRGDVPELVRLADNKKIADLLSRLPSPYTRADGVAFVEIFSQRADQRPYAVTMEGTGAFMGVVGFSFPANQPPELGYWLGEPHWGQGYMTEAVRGLLDAAHQTREFPMIRARALAENEASLRVLEAVGFKRVGKEKGAEGPHQDRTIILFELEQPRWT